MDEAWVATAELIATHFRRSKQMTMMLCSAARMSSKWQSVNHTSRAVGDKAVRISIAVQFPPQTHFSHSNRP